LLKDIKSKKIELGGKLSFLILYKIVVRKYEKNSQNKKIQFINFKLKVGVPMNRLYSNDYQPTSSTKVH